MTVNKNQLLDGLHKILTSKIANPRFYTARCRGFKSEIELPALARKKRWNLLDGGQCFFTWIDWPRAKNNSIIYVTVSFDSPQRYTEFYRLFSTLPILRESFFLQIESLKRWSTQEITVKNRDNRNIPTEILKPEFNTLKFNNGAFEKSSIEEIIQLFPAANTKPRICKNKNKQYLDYLKKYDLTSLAVIYANRFFLDTSLADITKGMIDFDGIIDADGDFTAIETKEKDPLKNGSNRNDWLFGWDSRRLSWYLYLKEQIQLDTLYVIREINNQTVRRLVAWRKIKLKEFCDCASWLSEYGGGGGSGTITAPYHKFAKLRYDTSCF